MRPTDRFENWFITSLQTGINDTTGSFRLNDNLNVPQARLVIDPYDESTREVVKVTSVDGNLVYVERGDDNTPASYHQEGAIVAMNVVAADMNDLYADWSDTKADLQQQQYDFELYMQGQQDSFETNMQGQQNDFEASVNTQISDIENLAFLGAHPVNSIYLTVDPTNPSTIYGGTWVAWGSGRVPVGVDTGQTEFNTVEKTGGAKTHTLSIAEMPSHTHTLNNATSVRRNVADSANMASGNMGYQKPDTITANNTGGGGAHNNLQPYITCYMFKRVS